MSHFDDLITQLCPDGVPFRPLSDLLDYGQPGKYLVASTSYDNSYPTPVLTAGQTFVLGYTSETDGIYPASPSSPVVIFDDFTTAFKWVDFAFKAKSSAMKMLTSNANDSASLRFVYYAMQTIKYAPKDHARQWIATYSHFRIPVPPVEVQSEIVRILDLFQSLQTEVQEELQARQVQYSYYRDTLLAFRGTEDVKRVPLGELATIVRGASPRPIQKFLTTAAEGVPWIKIGDVAKGGKYITSTEEYVSLEGAAKSRRVRPGDFVLSNSMSFGRPYISKIEGCIHDGWLAISNFEAAFVPYFLYHLLRSAPVQEQFERRAGGGSVRNLNADIVKSVAVPVPPLQEQARIVDILDKFDVLVNDPSISLTAELKVRRTQYEHYRNRLLTFDEAVA